MKKLVGYCLYKFYIFESRKAAIQQGFTSSGISRCLSNPDSRHCGFTFSMLTQQEVEQVAASMDMEVVEMKEAQA